jgi:hypothetical protein
VRAAGEEIFLSVFSFAKTFPGAAVSTSAVMGGGNGAFWRAKVIKDHCVMKRKKSKPEKKQKATFLPLHFQSRACPKTKRNPTRSRPYSNTLPDRTTPSLPQLEH